MKRTIDCDQVFEILTRGPFPSGESTDTAVEMHLIACHECRRLAEALRPAVDLFRENVSASEIEDLPSYQGVLCRWEADAAPKKTGLMLAEPRTRVVGLRKMLHAATRSDYAVARFTAALLFGATLMGFLWNWTNGDSSGEKTSGMASAWATDVARNSRVPDERLLASLDLPSFCRTISAPRNGAASPKIATTLTQAETQCCTQCHSATKKLASGHEALAKIARSCQLCHADVAPSSMN